MSKRNLLLGNGEKLTSQSEIKTNSGPKKYPYSIEEVRAHLQEPIKRIKERLSQLSPLAKPRGEAVFQLTLHPAFLGRSYFPEDLLRASGLRDVGSKQVNIIPRKVTSERSQGKKLATAKLFVAGKETDIERFEDVLNSQKSAQYLKRQAVQIEELEWFEASSKIRGELPPEENSQIYEAVLHAGPQEEDILQSFINFAKLNGAEVHNQKKIVVGALTFIPLFATASAVQTISNFAFLRAIRKMPELRMALPNVMRHAVQKETPVLPVDLPIDKERRAAIFDGGIGANDLSIWVNEFTFGDTINTDIAYLHHGTEVTSTFLFGRLDKENLSLNQPFMGVDHYRVISSNTPSDIDLFDVLIKIRDVLDTGAYSFANLSLGPRLPILDDEVHAWTATLDQVCAKHGILATVAVGNDGELDEELARIQPPSDMVNALAVGAADHYGPKWGRAAYSCIGPGRSPGFVKPDGVAFGGSEGEPFYSYNPWVGGVAAVAGTSYAAPLTLRTACGAAAMTAHPLDAIAIKALLIHHADKARIPREQVGWGRFPEDPIKLIECENDSATVIYQGILEKGQYLRAQVPFPNIPLAGAVSLKVTLCIQTPTDPEHVINYTRAGMQVVFRPRFGIGDETTTDFFGRKSQYKTEQEYRDDGHKWETCLHREKKFQLETELSDPVFDIRYHARATSRNVPAKSAPDIRYAMIITIKVDGVSDLYNLIRQRYRVLQPVPLRVNIDIPSA